MSDKVFDRWITIGLGCVPALIMLIVWMAVLGNDRAYALARLDKLEERVGAIETQSNQEAQDVAVIKNNVQWIKDELEKKGQKQ